MPTGINTFLSDLAVTIDDGDFNFSPGSTMGYTMTLGNNGPAAVTGAGFRLTLDLGISGSYSVIPLSMTGPARKRA